MAGSRGSTSSSAASNTSDSSYRPLSPASPSATTKPAPVSRKRSSTKSGSVVTKDDYSLPPPPTRSRKIIQMQPKESQESAKAVPPTNANSKAQPPSATSAAGKKKQAGPNTAQGRKIARKTAHSLIERRRRSKMNEEFGVLKDMIPACAGQEMHKLAILQASIDYMRYLEQCVTDLKASHRSRQESPTTTSPKPPVPTSSFAKRVESEDEEEDEDEDEDMEDAVSPTQMASTAPPKQSFQFADVSPAIYPTDASVHSNTTSPNLYPSDRHYSVTASPAIHPSDPHHYSLASSVRSTVTSPSIQASPAFGAQPVSQSHFQNPFTVSKGSVSGPAGGMHFALTSPALGPQAEREDHEATEALLMLNTDRRNWNDKDAKRGISVNDLLSR